MQNNDLQIIINNQYKNVNLNKDVNQIDYQNIHINWGNIETYQIIKLIGRGKYSHVFKGYDYQNQCEVAIKILNQIRKSKIKREFHILKKLNHKNIAKFLNIVRYQQGKVASFIFQWIPHQNINELYLKFNYSDIRFYMKQLLTTLDYIHSQGVIHRDIKPHNILIDHTKRTLKIVDFGLAEYYFPEKSYSTRVASLYYKAPQLLLGDTYYDYSIDMWAVGIFMAGLVNDKLKQIFRKMPFLVGLDKFDQLNKIIKIVGTDQMTSFIKVNQKTFQQQLSFRQQLLNLLHMPDIKKYPKSTLLQFKNKQNAEFITQQSLSLILGLLKLNKNQRLTPKLALEHLFFKNKT